MKESENNETLSSLSAIILAAGKGTRMASPLPKVLHPVAGVPMVNKVISACRGAGASDIRVVVGHGQNLVRSVVQPLGANCFEQTQQLGTADAVKAANPDTLDGLVIIVNGDHPLIEASDIQQFVTEFKAQKADLAVVTAELKNPDQFGRIVRHMGELHAIVEAKDASADTLKIREINTGIYVTKAKLLADILPEIKNNNLKGEYYLTDIVGLCKEYRKKVVAIKGNAKVAVGVNTQLELAKANRAVFRRKIKNLMELGVVVLNPLTTYVEEEVQVGQASVLYPGAYLRGQTKIGNYSVIEPNCYVVNCQIGDSVQIKAGSYLENSVIRDRASVGPYARLRPETEIGIEAHIGNFVELKKVKFGDKSKAGHLTYLGDAEIGSEVNVGCGTITCNYAVDRKKYKTKIGNNVFVGSDSQFVAPVEVGDNAVIASGSTITQNVPANALAIARGKQVNKENYVVKNPEVKDSDKK